MVEFKIMELKSSEPSKSNNFLNTEPCLNVEELLKSCKLESSESLGCNFDFREDYNCHLSAKHVFAITGLKLPHEETEQMLHHLEFCNLVGHTVTEDDFRVLYHHSSIDFHDKDTLWDHNKRCSVLFVKGFRSTLNIISVCKENGTDNDIVVAFARELLDRIARHHETRRYFNFCEGCEYHRPNKCIFWEDVARSLHPLLALTNEAVCADFIRSYSAGLEILCRIPNSLDALKEQVNQLGGV